MNEPITKEELSDFWEIEDRRHRDAIAALRQRNAEFQKTCEHKQEWVHYEPDSSGNNDDYNECRKCGKQW